MYLLFCRVPVTLKEVQKASQTRSWDQTIWGVHPFHFHPHSLHFHSSAICLSHTPATPVHHHGLPFPPPSPPRCPAVPRPELPLAPGPGPWATPCAAGTAGGTADPRGRAQQGPGGHRGGEPAGGAGAGADFGVGLGNGAMELLGCEVWEMFF